MKVIFSTPTRWAFKCHGVDRDLEAVVPDALIRSIPPDARISFVWTVCPLPESRVDAGATS